MLELPEFKSTVATKRRFGFECEVSGAASRAVRLLHSEGLCSVNHLHAYHCGCNECQVDGVDWEFHAQNDCTVAGEIITSILEYGSGKADRAITGLAKTLREVRVKVETNAGFHVHVDQTDLDQDQKNRAWRIFMRYQDDIGELASGRFSGVRGYNAKMAVRSDRFWTVSDSDQACNYTMGSWLYNKGATLEFRLWNATRMEWRMRMNVGVSVGIVEAAAQGEDVTRNDPRTFDEVLFDYFDANTWAGIIRQREIKELGIARSTRYSS